MSVLRNTDFDYKLERISNLDFAAFDRYFENLPLDPYIQGKFRLRRFSRFQGPPEDLKRLEHKYFEQSAAVNKLAGGVKRDFAELEDQLTALPDFQMLVAQFVDFSKIEPATSQIGVHQIRIVAGPGMMGEPAPEGIHQDGFDFGAGSPIIPGPARSEEHTSELQSLRHLVCRLLLEKKTPYIINLNIM